MPLTSVKFDEVSCEKANGCEWPECQCRRKEPRGTFVCPICGENTPHHHSTEIEKRAECTGCMCPACEDCFDPEPTSVFPLLFTTGWLANKIAADPDIECEAGPDLSTPFYGAQCPSYPNCNGGCGLGCTHEIEAPSPVSKISDAQRKLDASVTEKHAREYVRRERERNINRDKPIAAPRDGFINDYD